MTPTVADVVARVSDAAFGKPLVMNVLRGLVVEAIVASLLEPEWHWCAADYASWDFQHNDGTRLEVRQSARRQSWPLTSIRPARPSFDIRPRTGRRKDGNWIGEPGRAADLYLFGYHDRVDDQADHRDPAQWCFFVIPAASLPGTKTISLSTIRQLNDPVCAAGLLAVIDSARRHAVDPDLGYNDQRLDV